MPNNEIIDFSVNLIFAVIQCFVIFNLLFCATSMISDTEQLFYILHICSVRGCSVSCIHLVVMFIVFN